MPWQSVAQETNANHAQRVNKWATDDGIYFGYQVEKPIIENRPLESPWDVKNACHRYRGERHILTVGPNGSGKTRRLLIPKGIIMGLRLDLGADASLAYLRLVLGRSPEDLAVFNTNLVNRHGKSHPEIAASISEFMHYNPEDRELGAIRRTAKVQTDWLDSPRIGADLQHGTFNFASIKRYPTTIFEGPNDRL
jgi:hypothetical protein